MKEHQSLLGASGFYNAMLELKLFCYILVFSAFIARTNKKQI